LPRCFLSGPDDRPITYLQCGDVREVLAVGDYRDGNRPNRIKHGVIDRRHNLLRLARASGPDIGVPFCDHPGDDSGQGLVTRIDSDIICVLRDCDDGRDGDAIGTLGDAGRDDQFWCRFGAASRLNAYGIVLPRLDDGISDVYFEQRAGRWGRGRGRRIFLLLCIGHLDLCGCIPATFFIFLVLFIELADDPMGLLDEYTCGRSERRGPNVRSYADEAHIEYDRRIGLAVEASDDRLAVYIASSDVPEVGT
jgi:hypothetical protein